mmetsp:Transcript_14174/g.55776  ORF Transcript_14174/g.55776 Transcript_14174/m.55776 type:complete len:202 (+) Transcript_14174:2542-3147(+)
MSDVQHLVVGRAQCCCVWVAAPCVLEHVVKEERVSWDALDRHDHVVFQALAEALRLHAFEDGLEVRILLPLCQDLHNHLVVADVLRIRLEVHHDVEEDAADLEERVIHVDVLERREQGDVVAPNHLHSREDQSELLLELRLEHFRELLVLGKSVEKRLNEHSEVLYVDRLRSLDLLEDANSSRSVLCESDLLLRRKASTNS